MVGQSLTTRTVKERLEALKKILPLRDRIREKLQQRQLFQTDFTEDTEQLFKPIVSATEGVKTATERAIYGDIPEEGKRIERPLLGELEKIAIETGQTKQAVQKLSGDMATQMEIQRQSGIDVGDELPLESKRTVEGLRERFNEAGIAEIDNTKQVDIPVFVVTSYEKRKKMLKKEYHKYIKDLQHYADVIYKIKTEKSQIKTDSASYIKYMEIVGNVYNQYEELKQQQKPQKLQRRKHPSKKISFSPKKSKPSSEIDTQGATGVDTELEDFLKSLQDEGSSGKGYSSGSGLVGKNPMDFHTSRNASVSGNTSISCPGNILGDIARLEVLVGGKRAGNNSPEIINEAADICRRLFQGGIMDIATYRDFIEELAENPADFYGYHSD